LDFIGGPNGRTETEEENHTFKRAYPCHESRAYWSTSLGGSEKKNLSDSDGVMKQETLDQNQKSIGRQYQKKSE